MVEPTSGGTDASIHTVITVSDLDELIGRFASEYLADRSEETVGTYTRALNEFQRYHARSPSRFGFTEADVLGYKQHLTDVRELHEVSVSTYLTAVRRLCQFLVDLGRLEANPAAGVKGNRRPDDHSRDVLTRKEIVDLIEAIDGPSQLEKRDRAIIASMAFAGLSEIEIVRADYGDLEQTLLGWYLRVQGKGRSSKDEQVPLDQPVVGPLRVYIEARGRLLFRDPLFASHGNRSEGERLNTRSIRSRINQWLKRFDLKRPGITPHSLTHAAPLLWLDDGMDIEDVRRRMRHGSLDTTMIYFRKQGLVGRQDAKP